MREILFRGLEINSTEWGCGNFIAWDNRAFIHFNDADSKNKWREVRFDTVGQYTGLKDKSGVGIYEGDIVLAGHYKWKCKVVWDEKCARFIGLTNDKDAKLVYLDMVDKNGVSAVEVIGNVYDNPELLQSQN